MIVNASAFCTLIDSGVLYERLGRYHEEQKFCWQLLARGMRGECNLSGGIWERAEPW